MDRVEILNPMHGLCGMVVCAAADATDEEILAVCNAQNPSGTTNGWMEVVRETNEDYGDNARPVPCRDDPTRRHMLVTC